MITSTLGEKILWYVYVEMLVSISENPAELFVKGTHLPSQSKGSGSIN